MPPGGLVAGGNGTGEATRAAGAILVDPIVIPNLKRPLATREGNPIETDAALGLYLARNPGSPFKTRQDIISSPDIDKSFPPPNVARYKAPSAPLDAARYVEYVRARDELMISIAKIMADNKLDAIVHKSMTVPSGFTSNNRESRTCSIPRDRGLWL